MFKCLNAVMLQLGQNKAQRPDVSSILKPQGLFGHHFETQPIGNLSLKNMAIDSRILNQWKMLLHIIVG